MFNRFLIFLGLILTLAPACGFAEEDFLPPEQAFAIQKPEVRSSADGNKIIISWKIADDYYIYRNKVEFLSNETGLNLGAAKLSDSETKNDPFFGEIEIYKHQLRAEIPFTADASPGTVYELTAKSQGCANAGICYPPLKQKVSFKLPEGFKDRSPPPVAPPTVIAADATENVAANPVDTLANLGNQTSAGAQFDDDVLEIDEAFKFDLSTDQNNQLIAIWSIAEGHYLYKDKFKFELLNDTGFTLGPAPMPKGKQKSDEYFGDFEAYYKDLTIKIPVTGAGDNSKPLAVKVSYQGCSEAGICYPMVRKNVELDVSEFSTLLAAAPPASSALKVAPEGSSQAVVQSEQDALASMLVTDNKLIALLTFFVIGLGLAFTPCVFPMIPILSGIIAGQGSEVTSRKAFTMSVVYVLSMAVVYTAVGIIAGLSGKNIQVVFQNPWVIGSFALIFVLLALSMFGFYNLQLPSRLQSRLSEISNKQQGGSLIGVSIMGVLSAVIVGPCMAPPLMGILLFIGQTGDPILGGLALFVMSLGMGIPLIILGTSAGKFMPKAGVWMDTVKAVFGVSMLAVAIWMLERILPASIIMWLWALLLFISGVYMGALAPIHDNTSGWDRLWKALGLIMMLYAAVLIIGVSSGNTNYLLPLQGHSTLQSEGRPQHLAFTPIKSVADLQQQLNTAKQQNRPLMLDFYADWCTYCISMEKTTFQSQKVITALEDFIVLQADVTANDELDEQLMKHLSVPAPPAILFYDPVSGENRAFRVVGYKNGDDFAEHVKKFTAQ